MSYKNTFFLENELEKQMLYRKFCEQYFDELPVFMQTWWLDAVCGRANWSALMTADERGNVVAAWTYHFRKKYFLNTILMPPFTPFMGVWFGEQTLNNDVNFIRKKNNILMSQLPATHFFFQKFHYSLTDWQPFFWNGCQQTTHYTYTLGLEKSVEILFQQANKNTQRNIKKSEQHFDIKIIENAPPQYNPSSILPKEGRNDFLTKLATTFYEMNGLTFERQGLENKLSIGFLKQLFEAVLEKKSGFFLLAFPKNKVQDMENAVAIIFIVFDKKVAYYLGGGALNVARERGATFGLLWQGILNAKKRNIQIFDFEGSMLQNIEPIFRNFGATQQAYHRIWKTKNRFFDVLNLFLKIK